MGIEAVTLYAKDEKKRYPKTNLIASKRNSRVIFN